MTVQYTLLKLTKNWEKLKKFWIFFKQQHFSYESEENEEQIDLNATDHVRVDYDHDWCDLLLVDVPGARLIALTSTPAVPQNVVWLAEP